MRVLVTGATSPLGVAFCEAARGANIEVFSAIRSRTDAEKDSGQRTTIPLHLGDTASFDRIPDGLDAIVHIAAANEGSAEHLMNINGFGTRLLVDAAIKRKIPRIIHISSMSVYGTVNEHTVDSVTPVRHSTPYGLSKWAAECYLHCAWPHLKSVSVRSPAIVGKVARRNFLALLHDAMKRQVRAVEVKNPDFLFNNLVHSDAFSEFLITLLRQPLDCFSAFPIASVDPIPLREVVLEVARACDYSGEIKWVTSSDRPFAIDSSFAIGLGYKPWTVSKSLKKWLQN